MTGHPYFETETLDKLYLDWSQFTRARTQREIRMHNALKAALEIYAGSEGFLSETPAEEYQKRIIEQMVVEIQKGLGIKQ